MTEEPNVFKCQECNRKFKTVAAAERAMNSDRGCPGCGGSDIDIDPTADPRKATRPGGGVSAGDAATRIRSRNSTNQGA
jgi:hypothetical protein